MSSSTLAPSPAPHAPRVARPPALPGSARAIEVAAMLGDTVVSVKHCIDPRAGKLTLATWAVLAGAAGCLVAAAIVFGAALHVARDNRARLDAWTQLEHRPAYAFRPRRVAPASDVVAFGGLALAVAGLAVGVVRAHRERRSPSYRIGTAPGVELAVLGAPAPAFPLIAPSGDGFVLSWAAGIDGELVEADRATPLAALAAAGRARPSTVAPAAFALAIPPRARVRVRVGQTTIIVAAVDPPRRLATPRLAGLERRAVAYAAGSLAVHLAIWAVLAAMPPQASAIALELPTAEAIAAHLQGTAANDPVAPLADAAGDGDRQPGSAAMALPPGTAGTALTPDRGRRQAAEAGSPARPSRDEAIAAAREAGLLGTELLERSIRAVGGGAGAPGGGDPGSFDGPIYGGGGGPGGFGRGRRGLDLGDDTYGTCGCGRDGFTGWSRAAGGHYALAGRRGHRAAVPEPGAPVISGVSYDKAIIRRYLRRQLDRIAYCYDKQLLSHPDLGGEITVAFLIGPSGAVQTATGTGFDRDVAACVAGVVRAIEFPRPGDGAGVLVNYPFQFRPAGR